MSETLQNCSPFSSCTSHMSPSVILDILLKSVAVLFVYSRGASTLLQCHLFLGTLVAGSVLECSASSRLYFSFTLSYIDWDMFVNNDVFQWTYCVGWHKNNIIFIKLCSCKRWQTHNLSRWVTGHPPFCVYHLSASVFIVIIQTRSNYIQGAAA